MSIMRRQSPNDLMSLMGISQELAELNVQRFQDWNPPFDKNNARQAVLAFKGDVYLEWRQGLIPSGTLTSPRKICAYFQASTDCSVLSI